jgi:hypothetical protein
MKDHSAMSGYIRESMLLTLVLCGMARASQALAGDETPSADSALRLDTENSRQSEFAAASMLSPRFAAVKPIAEEVFSASEFRPRKRTILNADSPRNAAAIIDAPMLKNNSVWQQMAEFKSQDRVRLLTLWQMHGSSLSLQAGKRGAPSLQWSSPWMRRDGASRGLFDRLLAVPARGVGGMYPRRNTPRPTNVIASIKSFEPGISTK